MRREALLKGITGIRFGTRILQQLDALAKALGRSRSEIVREAVSLLFKRYGVMPFGEEEKGEL